MSGRISSSVAEQFVLHKPGKEVQDLGRWDKARTGGSLEKGGARRPRARDKMVGSDMQVNGLRRAGGRVAHEPGRDVWAARR